MKLVFISPEHDEPREIAVLGALFAAGLERYHVRKPHWSAAQLETWLRALPADWRPRLVLHSHHELVEKFNLGGRHWRDEKVGRVIPNPPLQPLDMQGKRRVTDNAPYLPITSRSCHDLATLRAAFGHYDSVFFGPIFPSISKPGYTTELTVQVERGVSTRSFKNKDLNASGRRVPPAELSSLLNSRTPDERRTTVLALGGVTAGRLPQVRAFGFDGVAVLGAVWQADDPVAAFVELTSACAGGARCPQRASARSESEPYLQPNHAA
ncbi:MAG TPA: thiamine phosphate synthase [Opitutaceae bacterium]|nr:thiamine phosphate synthase [Opitutaceae bacterium]